MPKKHQRFKVVKVPLKKSPIIRNQVFPRIPLLYLELIENKSKIKQDLIGKEYIPSSSPAIRTDSVSRNSPKPTDRITDKPRSGNGGHKDSKSVDKHTDKHTDKHKSVDHLESRLDKLLSDNDTESVASVASTSSSSDSDLSIKERKHDKHDDDDNTSDSSDSSRLSVRLKELLNDDSETGSEHYKSGDKYSRHRDVLGHSVARSKVHDVPTLTELEKRGGYIPRKELRDINQVTMSEQKDEDDKRELLFKFEVLRKSYPGSDIPDYTVHTDYTLMKKSYDDTVRRLSLDSTVENYKKYLVYGFIGCEYVFGNFLGFDMQGFTQQQLNSMNSYEKLLIELGEKSYMPTGSKWPVELRLLFVIMMNAVIFVVSKMIMKKTGANLMGMVGNMGMNSHMTARKRRMRGPNIDIDDIPDI